MVDVCIKYHYPIGLDVHKTELNIVQLSMKSRSRSETVDGSGEAVLWRMCV